jgi:hypothetical protein
MKLQKIIAVSTIVTFLPIYYAFADLDIQTANQLITSLQNTVSKYAETIKQLQDENAKLKSQIAGVTSTTVASSTVSNAASTGTVAIITPSTISSVDKYNKLIDKINFMSEEIFASNNLSKTSSIWLFEFIEPSSFFISIDDKKNPDGVSAFKRKILYSYDKNLNLNVDWIFDLDYASWYYKTLQWKNPFAKATRIKLKNPIYTWKLIVSTDSTTVSTSAAAAATTSTAGKTNTTTSSTSTTTVSWNVSLDDIRNAYNKNKILDALKLSNEYIKKDPDNIEVAKIRYRSFHILWKYNEALLEIQKIENAVWTDKLEKVVACDAKIISKLVKNADLNKKYTDLCAKK